MSIETIRVAYGVPAKIGGKIRFSDNNGKQWTGKITGTDGARLRVSLEGYHRDTAYLHPTWNVEYLD